MSNELSFHLEIYDGPLDLLLGLITKNKVDIYDIPIAMILDQYLEYLDMMREMDMEIAGEFIVMAADLMLIKSRMLLPKPQIEGVEEEDPRAVLARALIEYKRAKEASVYLHDQYSIYAGRIAKEPEVLDTRSDLPDHIDIDLLSRAMQRALIKNSRLPELARESEKAIRRLLAAKVVPVSAKIITVMKYLRQNGRSNFEDILLTAKSRSELIAIFSATLELLKVQRVIMENEDDTVYLILSLTHLREVMYNGQEGTDPDN
ncbi:MAG: segregation/condensation protein A [Ruminococcaceae bacterium]|nr:segregation/condensation protein A [Oscillospiraceae bacterium]